MIKINTKQTAKGLAEILEKHNKPDEAEQIYLNVIASLEKDFGKQNIRLMSTYKDIGDLYFREYKYSEAESFYLRALRAKTETLQQGAASGGGLKEVFAGLRAVSAILKSMGAGNSNGETSSYIGASILMNLAEIYFRTDRIQSIRDLYATQFTELEEEGQKYADKFDAANLDLAPLQTTFARLLADYDPEAAQEMYFRAFSKVDSFASKSAGILLIDASIMNVEKQTQYVTDYMIAQAYHNKHRLSPEYIRKTYDYWSRSKGRLLDYQKKLQSAIAASSDADVRSSFQDLQRTKKQLLFSVDTMSDEDLVKLLVHTMELQFRLGRKLASTVAESSQETDFIKLMPSDAILIDFVRITDFDFKTQKHTEDAYYAFVINPTHQIDLIRIGRAQDIDNLITLYHAEIKTALSASSIPSERNLKKIGSQLYQLILMPLSKHIDKQRLLISPDSKLNLIPFEVFVAPDGDYAINKYNVSYGTTLQDFFPPGINSESSQNAVFFADPDFDYGRTPSQAESSGGNIYMRSLGRVSNSFQSLPETKREVDDISKVIRERMNIKTQSFCQSDANEKTLMNVVSPRILHLATHGFFLDDIQQEHSDSTDERSSLNKTLYSSPMLRSGIALTGANASLLNGDDRGILVATKIIGLDLRQTELVVLSACSTGIGEVLPGEGVFGVKRAFAIAGAKNMIISLWNVASNESIELMTTFYTHWASGESKSDAFRKARLEMLGKYHNPFFWGAFSMNGAL